MLAAARVAMLAAVLALSWQPAMAKRVAGASNLVTEDSYVNRDGIRVHKPVHAKSRPANATARCRDGSYSFSTHHRGTCSGHRGVVEWYR